MISRFVISFFGTPNWTRWPTQEDQRRHPDGDLPPAGRGRRDLEGGLCLRAEQPGDGRGENEQRKGGMSQRSTNWMGSNEFNPLIFWI